MNELFRRFAHTTAGAVGSPAAFLIAAVVIAGWAVTGPLFGYSDTWQLVINTSTTIITFLVVFLIQNTQNRDAKAMQLKLDELIRAVSEARTSLVDLEDLSDADLERLHREFQALQRKERKAHPEQDPRVEGERGWTDGVGLRGSSASARHSIGSNRTRGSEMT